MQLQLHRDLKLNFTMKLVTNICKVMEFVEKEDTIMEKSMGISIPSVNNSIVSYEQSQVTNVNNKGGKTVDLSLIHI